jgi:hypothetical protein
MIALLDMRALFVEFDEERNYKLIGHGDISKPIDTELLEKIIARVSFFCINVKCHWDSITNPIRIT